MESRSLVLAISFLVLATVTPMAALAGGKTYYVKKTTGKDSNPGTSAKPFETLTKANSLIKPGDKVIVGEGHYSSFTIKQNNVHFESLDRKAVIDARGKQEYAIRIIGNHVTLKGFDITGSTGGGVQVRQTHHVALLENDLHHNKGPGIYTWRSDYLKIADNEMSYNGGDTAAAGISIHSPRHYGPIHGDYNIMILRNYIHHNKMTAKGTEGWGVILDGVERGIPGGYKTWLAYYTGHTLIKDNFIGYNGKGGILTHYAQNADIIHNATRSNAVDEWVGNGFEIGVRASKNIALIDNSCISYGGGPAPADYVITVWEGSTGYLQGNYASEKGDTSNDGIAVDASSSVQFLKDHLLNNYGLYKELQRPEGWKFF